MQNRYGRSTWGPTMSGRVYSTSQPAKAALIPAPESKDTQEAEALAFLAEVFKYNATSRQLEKGPYAKEAKIERCTFDTLNGPCKLARKKGKRCEAHENFTLIAAGGFKAEEVFESSPVEQRVTERLLAIKL